MSSTLPAIGHVLGVLLIRSQGLWQDRLPLCTNVVPTGTSQQIVMKGLSRLRLLFAQWTGQYLLVIAAEQWIPCQGLNQRRSTSLSQTLGPSSKIEWQMVRNPYRIMSSCPEHITINVAFQSLHRQVDDLQ